MAEPKPVVGIIVSSQDDWETLNHSGEILDRLSVPYETRMVSLHRTPKRLEEYVTSAKARGIKVLIAGAGGMSAALPGAAAGLTTLPVLGVPLEGNLMGGMDALLSIVQMPGGVPVAAVGIGKAGAKNAAILAIQILSTADKALKKKIIDFKKKQAEKVIQKDKNVKKLLKKSKK